jgi:hypothetical protein
MSKFYHRATKVSLLGVRAHSIVGQRRPPAGECAPRLLARLSVCSFPAPSFRTCACHAADRRRASW